jgi:hypothetical protein
MNEIEGTPAGWISMVAIVLVMGVVWMLFCRRTRRLALGLLGIAVLGVLFLRVSHRPSPVRVYDGDTAHMEQMFDHQQHASLVQAEQAEILRNQRMAAQMDDAFVQKSPDGSTLETYPDGMQIRQRWPDGFRSIVRTANGGGWTSSQTTHSRVKFYLLGAPLLALLAAFWALKRSKRTGGVGFGPALIVAGVTAMLLFGLVFEGSSRQVRSGTEAQIAEVELGPGRITVASQAEFDRVHHEMLGNWHDVVQQEPIETLWTKLTAPKIKLDAPADNEATATERELANAAKVILSASAPGADPFTQGWLINAAKTILSEAKAPVADNGSIVEVATAAAPDPFAEPIAQYEAQHKATEAAKKALESAAVKVAHTPDEPRPDWVDAPPKLVGNTQRVVVSTDPFVTVEECHAALRDKLRGVVQTRVDELARAANGGHYASTPGLDSMGINIEYILSELCPEDDYIETVNASFGEMKRAHALVEFNDAQDRFLLDRWRAYARVQSIEVVAVLSAFVVGGLAFVYGLLKVDTWTRGYYTKRLFLGVPAAIIAVVAGFIAFVETFG